MLAALIAYYGFLSLFPLLLVLFTVLGLVAIIGLAGLLWGAQGVSQAGQHAMAEVWNIPMAERPSFLARLARSSLLFGVMGLFLLVSTALAGFSTFGAHSSSLGLPVRIGAGVVSVAVNAAIFLLSFRILTPKQISFRELGAGALVGGIAWTIFQAVGSYLVGHQLKTSSQVHGFFGVVLGLLAFIYLAAQISLYAAEVNVVKYRRMWPRGLVEPPLTRADKEAMATRAKKEERIAEQEVGVGFEDDGSVEGDRQSAKTSA